MTQDKDTNLDKRPVPPSDEAEARERRRFFATGAIQAAESLRKSLGISEDHYRGTFGYNQHDARAYFLYGCLEEVFKVSTASIRWEEFMNDPDEAVKANEEAENEKQRHISRVVLEAVLDEQEMWRRKLNEFLADLILFAITNEQAYYQLYLACRLLDAYLGLQKDFEHFFACRSRNADWTIADLVRTILALQLRVDTSKLWFLRKPLAEGKVPKPGMLFCSVRRRFMQALELAKPDQRLIFGVSYEVAHSVPSRSIHASIGGPAHEKPGRAEVDRNIGHVGLLALHVVMAAHRLAGVELAGAVQELLGALARSDAPRMFYAVHQAEFAIGDIVTAYGRDVCEVVAMATSKYGYTSYKVRYITRPPLPEVPEDWFPARYVHLMFSRADLRKRIAEAFRAVGASPEDVGRVETVSEEDLSRVITKTFRELESTGLLGRLFRRQASRVDDSPFGPPRPSRDQTKNKG